MEAIVINDETIALISTAVLGLVGAKLVFVFRKISELKDLIVDLNDSLYDNTISSEESRKISDRIRKLISK